MAAAKRRALPPTLRAEVWRRYIGDHLDGICWCCERNPINAICAVEYGHVIAHARGGADTVDNLRPICAACNKSMQTRDMMEYKRELLASFAPISTREPSLISSALTNVTGIRPPITIPLADAPMWAKILRIKSREPDKIIGAILARNYKLPTKIRATTFGPQSRSEIITFVRHQSSEILAQIFAQQSAREPDVPQLSREQLVAQALSCITWKGSN